MNKPNSKDFATTLAKTSLTKEEKEEIINSLPYLSDEKIVNLYKKLQELLIEETEFIKSIERTDLKYQMKVEAELKKFEK